MLPVIFSEFLPVILISAARQKQPVISEFAICPIVRPPGGGGGTP